MPWAPVYAETAALRAFVRIPEDDESDDEQLQRALETASRAVDRSAGRQFGRTDGLEARRFTPRCSRRGWVVIVDDLSDVEGMTVALDTAGDRSFATAVAAADVELLPLNHLERERPAESVRLRGAPAVRGLEGQVRITARWGWAAVPPAVEHATLLQASRLLSRRDSPFGVAGSPEAGSETRLLARVDPDVAVALEPYRRRAWVR